MTGPIAGIRVAIAMLALLGCFAAAFAQNPPAGAVTLTVVDENGLAISAAQVTIQMSGAAALHRTTDYAGECAWPASAAAYSVKVEKLGFYQAAVNSVDAQAKSLRIALAHEQVVQQEVNVAASTPGIDTGQISDLSSLTTSDIVNIPYPTNRDIRNLLPFNPGVIADFSGQVHVAGSSTYTTLYTLDSFDIRTPVNGTLDLRVSTDAVRSLDTESTRYPVQYGRSTGGVIAFNTGMGDNRFRYNATDFLPSFRQINGIHFDKFVPRFTISGPMRRNRAWFFDAVDMEYDNIYIPQLPAGADTDRLIRGSNLAKAQTNLGAHNSLTAGLLVNDYHSPYEGLSALVPQQSTDNHDILAWLPYVRDQQGLKNGTAIDAGFAVMRYREGWEPHGSAPYELTPEQSMGSDFDTQTTRSQRIEGNVNIYFPARRWHGAHQVTAGVDLDRVSFDEYEAFAPVSYLNEAGTRVRQSVFPEFAPFGRRNAELGAYLEDRWTPIAGLLVEPGLRFDWDEIVRRPLFSPRIAFNYSPDAATKFTAGFGVYHEHTQLEYLTRAQAGTRFDTYFAADGVTPTGPALETVFTENDGTLRAPRTLNWSAGVEHRLPGQIYGGANYIQKRLTGALVYEQENGTSPLAGNFALGNTRQDHYYSVEVHARRTFVGGYTLFGSYTRSSARTNSALNYVPTIPILGAQQSGPLDWDTPNRVLSWGWLPAWAPKMPSVHKNWDFVYTLDWHTGFPYDSIGASEQLVGAPGSRRFPNYLSIGPGLEWRFHFRGKYFGLRGSIENITNSADPFVVYNNVDSPLYGTFSESIGRAFTTRIRLIESK